MSIKEAIALYELLRQARKPNTPLAQVARDVEELRKIAKRLDSLAVAWCNTGLSPRQETMRENLKDKLPVVLARYVGVTAETGGDPRGYALKLHFTSGPAENSYNTMGGAEAGYGVAA